MTSIVNYSLVACVVQSWMLYLGGFISFLDFTSTTLFRSTISKNVHPTEVGRVYSVLGIFQALIPLATGTIFNTLYRCLQMSRNMNIAILFIHSFSLQENCSRRSCYSVLPSHCYKMLDVPAIIRSGQLVQKNCSTFKN